VSRVACICRSQKPKQMTLTSAPRHHTFRALKGPLSLNSHKETVKNEVLRL